MTARSVRRLDERLRKGDHRFPRELLPAS